MRVRALPPSENVREFIEKHERVLLIEQNRDAQMASILRSEFPALATRIGSILNYNGMPLDAKSVVTGVLVSLNTERKQRGEAGWQPWMYMAPGV
jgi:2-oxoglutarate ferredoxin oxidoreductase subunit alpha